jgi:hypothetical protein
MKKMNHSKAAVQSTIGISLSNTPQTNDFQQNADVKWEIIKILKANITSKELEIIMNEPTDKF